MIGLRLALIEGCHSQELYSAGDVTVMVALSPNLRRGADAEVFPFPGIANLEFEYLGSNGRA